MSLLKYLFIYLTVFISYSFSVDFSQEELEFIKSKKSVTIALTDDPPFTFKENKEIKGYLKDLTDLISKTSGLEFKTQVKPWKDNFQDFRDRKIDITTDLFYKKEREDYTLFSKPYTKLPIVVFATKHFDYKGIQDLKGLKVGVIINTPFKKILESDEDIEIIEFTDQNEQMISLSYEKIDIAIQTLQTGNYYINKNHLTNIKVLNNFNKQNEDLHFGIQKELPLLHSIINKTLDSFSELQWRELERNFILSSYPSKQKLELSKKEKEFLKKYPIITLGTEKSWEPYVVVKENGEIKGYDAEVLEFINSITGANFQLVAGNWIEMQKLAKERKIDGLSTGAIHEERKKYLNFSDIYISLEKMVLVKHRNPKNIFSKKDLEGKTIVIHKGNFVDEKLAKEFSKSKIIFKDTVEEMLKEVIFGEADATFGNGATEYLTNKLGLPYLDFAFPLDHRLDLAFGVRKDYPEAVSILNKGLQEIGEHQLNQIKQKWFFLSKVEKNNQNIISPIKLGVNEKLYLKSLDKLTYCVDPNWLPYEKIEENKHIGMVADFVELVRKKLGITLELVPTTTWSQTMEFAQKRECDIVTSAQETESRKEFLNFTTPYATFPLVVATLDNNIFIDDISKFLDKKFAVVKGFAPIEILKSKYPRIQIVEVESAKNGLSLVEKEEVFGYIDGVASIGYSIQKDNFYDLKINGRLDEQWKLSFAIRNDKPELLSIFEKAVESISEQERDEIYSNWLKIKYEQQVNYTLVYQIVIFFILALAIFIYWNRKLTTFNTQLEKRVSEEIKKNKEKETMLMHYSKISSMGELVGNIAHQWRQPLTEIGSQIMILETKRKLGVPLEKNELDEYISKNNQILEHMSETIETFLNIYKKDAKEDSSFNIQEEIEKTLLIISGTFLKKNIFIDTEIESIDLIGNKGEFAQIILTLLHNCKDAAEESENKEKKVSIKAFKKNKQIVLIVKDNLGGIKKDIHSIFDLNVTNKESGLGIGLYIAKNIIEDKFNGTIEASNTDVGAKFTIVLNEEKNV